MEERERCYSFIICYIILVITSELVLGHNNLGVTLIINLLKLFIEFIILLLKRIFLSEPRPHNNLTYFKVYYFMLMGKVNLNFSGKKVSQKSILAGM
jgi:hypothetical protein